MLLVKSVNIDNTFAGSANAKPRQLLVLCISNLLITRTLALRLWTVLFIWIYSQNRNKATHFKTVINIFNDSLKDNKLGTSATKRFHWINSCTSRDRDSLSFFDKKLEYGQNQSNLLPSVWETIFCWTMSEENHRMHPLLCVFVYLCPRTQRVTCRLYLRGIKMIIELNRRQQNTWCTAKIKATSIFIQTNFSLQLQLWN